MWCRHCRQDVPAIAVAGRLACCAGCGHTLPAGTDETNLAEGLASMAEQGIELAIERSDETPPKSLLGDDWLLDDEIRRLHRNAQATTTCEPQATTAIDWTTPTAPLSGAFSAPPPAMAAPAAKQPSYVAWVILSLGLMAFAFGSVLLAWSFIAGRDDLWNLGMPTTLAGQFALLLGLVMQLDCLWQANRRTTDTLTGVDQRLHEINHATTLLRTTHTAPAQSFYAHMAEGASPHLLLADLKGQLDLLAVKMASQR